MNFNEKSVLITGASSGIGKSIAGELSKYNCTLFLLARRTHLIAEYSKKFKNQNASINIINCDVGNKDSVKNAFEEIKNKVEYIDAAILNAGVGIWSSADNFNSESAEETIKTNVLGLIYWVEQLLPGMIKRKSGMIAGVSSLADNRGYSGSGFYCASKAAASIFLEGLRADVNKYGIKVITVKPGFIKTPMTDKNEFRMPFLMSAEKAAKIVIKGLTKENRVIQFPLPTVIGSKIIGNLPGWLYDKLSSRLK